MPDLHEQILAEIERREQIARKATSGQWCRDIAGDIYALKTAPITAHVGEVDSAADAEHIALHDPADALRRYAAARRVLERHHRVDDADNGSLCGMCSVFDDGEALLLAPWPCPDATDLAASLGIEVES